MKMTLSSSSMASDNRSNSPNSSPHTSPKPSPRPQNKRDHSKSDTYLTVSYKEAMNLQKGGGDTTPSIASSERADTVSIRAGASSEQLSPSECNKTESSGTCGSSGKDKKDGRIKKKAAWYSGFYPTYKSRSGDYRQIFKDVPDDERLVVDYSCALQKEILVQGRLYVSQNYLCFYANIFGWETNVSFKWKEVTAITKEKTALVIPNAILVAVKDERFFFTSFVAREKTYMMLFRVWQNALMEKPMNQQEMWQLVHDSYGAELGLTSEDEDYIAPGTEDEKLSVNFSIDSYSEDGGSNIDSMIGERHPFDTKLYDDFSPMAQTETKTLTPFSPTETKRPTDLLNDLNLLPTDMSDSSDSEKDKIANVKSLSLSPRSSQELNPSALISYDFNPDPSRSSSDEKLYPVCTALHEGRQLLNEVIPLHIDQLFTLLFTSSKFFLDFHASKKTADLTQTTWTHNSLNGTKSRIISLTVALNQTVGPKTAQVTETQVMLTCSKAGFLYSIDVETVNAGIPYADSFCILVHYCLHRISDTQSSIAVYAQIKYKKTVWGLVKGMIEKNCWSGLEDFFTCLGKALLLEAEEMSCSAIKRKSRKRRMHHSKHRKSSEEILPARAIPKNKGLINRRLSHSNFVISIVFAVLILLVVLNILLYYKLWSLEETTPPSPPVIDLQVLKDPPKSHEDWLKLLQKQEMLHSVEMQKWARVLNTAIKLLKQTEESLLELQRSIQPTYKSKVMSIVESHQTTIKYNDSKDL